MSNQQQKSRDGAVVKSSNEPDYSAVELPTKPPTEFHYTERRAELLQLVEQAGHPGVLNQAELADRYGVSQQQISKDLDRLDEYIRERISNRRDLEIGSVLKRCMIGALDEDDYNTARKAAESYNEYMDRRIDTLEFRRRLDHLEDVAEQQRGGGLFDGC